MALRRPPEKQWTYRQPPEPFMRVPSAGCLLGPTASGKTTTAIALLLGPYKHVFDQIWVFSPSAHIDSAYEPLEKHIKNLRLGGGLVSEWDEAKLTEIIEKQKKTVGDEKKANQKKPLTSCLIYLDDWSDRPEYLHRSSGLITMLYLRNRHLGLSCWTGSQKMTSVSLTCRINFRWLLVWRLRSHKEMECVLHELSALYDTDVLLQMYNLATADDYSFWYIDMTQRRKDDMFWIRFEKKMTVKDES